eukprot:PhM_4_TR8468/c2_g1_i1/m.47343
MQRKKSVQIEQNDQMDTETTAVARSSQLQDARTRFARSSKKNNKTNNASQSNLANSAQHHSNKDNNNNTHSSHGSAIDFGPFDSDSLPPDQFVAFANYMESSTQVINRPGPIYNLLEAMGFDVTFQDAEDIFMIAFAVHKSQLMHNMNNNNNNNNNGNKTNKDAAQRSLDLNGFDNATLLRAIQLAVKLDHMTTEHALLEDTENTFEALGGSPTKESSTISTQELRDKLRPFMVDDLALQRFVSEVDTDGSGEIDLLEFNDMVTRMHSENETERSALLLAMRSLLSTSAMKSSSTSPLFFGSGNSNGLSPRHHSVSMFIPPQTDVWNTVNTLAGESVTAESGGCPPSGERSRTMSRRQSAVVDHLAVIAEMHRNQKTGEGVGELVGSTNQQGSSNRPVMTTSEMEHMLSSTQTTTSQQQQPFNLTMSLNQAFLLSGEGVGGGGGGVLGVSSSTAAGGKLSHRPHHSQPHCSSAVPHGGVILSSGVKAGIERLPFPELKKAYSRNMVPIKKPLPLPHFYIARKFDVSQGLQQSDHERRRATILKEHQSQRHETIHRNYGFNLQKHRRKTFQMASLQQQQQTRALRQSSLSSSAFFQSNSCLGSGTSSEFNNSNTNSPKTRRDIRKSRGVFSSMCSSSRTAMGVNLLGDSNFVVSVNYDENEDDANDQINNSDDIVENMGEIREQQQQQQQQRLSMSNTSNNIHHPQPKEVTYKHTTSPFMRQQSHSTSRTLDLSAPSWNKHSSGVMRSSLKRSAVRKIGEMTIEKEQQETLLLPPRPTSRQSSSHILFENEPVDDVRDMLLSRNCGTPTTPNKNNTPNHSRPPSRDAAPEPIHATPSVLSDVAHTLLPNITMFPSSGDRNVMAIRRRREWIRSQSPSKSKGQQQQQHLIRAATPPHPVCLSLRQSTTTIGSGGGGGSGSSPDQREDLTPGMTVNAQERKRLLLASMLTRPHTTSPYERIPLPLPMAMSNTIGGGGGGTMMRGSVRIK